LKGFIEVKKPNVRLKVRVKEKDYLIVRSRYADHAL